jgi:hypothetical protein
MNAAYQAVIGARDAERRDLFLTTARRLGTAVQNVEKDFWVCWTLDVLFNGPPTGGPRLPTFVREGIVAAVKNRR